jgi:hypothetical protein
MPVFKLGKLQAIALAAGLSIGAAGSAGAQQVFVDKGAAIKGYDPVAYFVDGKPVAGSPQFTHRWSGAEWRFASAANRDKFAAEPEKYAPQYGGFCAYGLSQGYKVKIEPDAWRIVDGKLYLNYDQSVQQTWVKDIPGYIAKADANWPKLRDKR